MDKYYNIAGFLICITGEESESVQRIAGFEFFEVKAGKPYFTLRLMSQVPQEILTKRESALLYTLDSEAVSSRFVRLIDESYCLTMTSTESSGKQLLLHHRSSNRECFLGGSMEPSLLRFALWAVFGMLTASQAIAIHASAIVVDGKAVILIGESSTEKSTHTDLWHQHIPGAVLLNDDNPIIRMDGSVPYICGSPWSGKTPCFRNERFPLAGIVCLSHAPHNQIRRLWMLEAINSMFPCCPALFSKDRELSRQIYDTLSEVLARVPVWKLECLPNEAAARLSYETTFSSLER